MRIVELFPDAEFLDGFLNVQNKLLWRILEASLNGFDDAGDAESEFPRVIIRSPAAIPFPEISASTNARCQATASRARVAPTPSGIEHRRVRF